MSITKNRHSQLIKLIMACRCMSLSSIPFRAAKILTKFPFLVNPGAKERLVQITGPNEESINYAKLLIEDTIKRNASPIREASQEGSCSSLASSDDQQVTAMPRARPVMQQQMPQMPMGNKLTRSNSNYLIHSLSTNDASLGEYKYTVCIGSHSLKITGDSLELVRVRWGRAGGI